MHRDTPYEQLTPEVILDSIEAVGFEPTGGLIPLNSYENRVYQVALENGEFVIAKFYRPDRWSEQSDFGGTRIHSRVNGCRTLSGAPNKLIWRRPESRHVAGTQWIQIRNLRAKRWAPSKHRRRGYSSSPVSNDRAAPR